MEELLTFISSNVFEGFLTASMRLAIPIMLAALGGVYNERAGVLNIGMEGIMLMGTLTGFVAAFFSNSIGVGLLAAILAGALLGLVLAFFTVTLNGDQVVVGIAFNLLMIGVSSFIFRAIFGIIQQPRITTLEMVPIPILSDIPILGPLFFRQTILVYIAYVLVFISYLVIQKSAWGLKIMATGENPVAAETLGINVPRIRYSGMFISGMFSGLGGAFLSLAATGLFLENMTAGRGYIALAILVLGRRHPVGLVGAALLFGAADALQLRTQILDIGIPFQFMLMLPYLLTIIVLAAFAGRTQDPAALGVHHNRQGERS